MNRGEKEKETIEELLRKECVCLCVRERRGSRAGKAGKTFARFCQGLFNLLAWSNKTVGRLHLRSNFEIEEYGVE